jgi:D-serine deaminase-like pyridoxal phosphate-dependent protein
MLPSFSWNEIYRIGNAEELLTPALAVYPKAVAGNIEQTICLLGGSADRWRVHIKTAKLNYTVRMLLDRGVANFKCATTLELLSACQAGAKDILLAYPSIGANARRVREIAEQYAGTVISVLIESPAQIAQWRGSRVGIFIDVNPGMNRTGVEQTRMTEIVELARAVEQTGLPFRGLHYYDGQYGSVPEPDRTHKAHCGYDQLLAIVNALRINGIRVAEVITAGTPTFPSSLSYSGFRDHSLFLHRASPGTVVYHDAVSLSQLPSDYAYQPAALVIARVVSHPRKGIITCDAGHKSVSADAGVPTCRVAGHPELTPLSPSEEHLPMSVAEGARTPEPGELLYLLPRHICPTVNNFDHALIVRDGAIESIEQVTARGREAPVLQRTRLLAAD